MMNDEFVFVAVGLPVSRVDEFNYSGKINLWVMSVTFKKQQNCLSDVAFKILRNGTYVSIKESVMSSMESTVLLPFMCSSGDVIELECTNNTDTCDMIITHKSISPE